MFGIGMPEMILILAVALIVIGPKKLPDLAKSLGRALGEFKKATNDFKDSISMESTLNDVKDEFKDLEKRVKHPLSSSDTDKKGKDGKDSTPSKTEPAAKESNDSDTAGEAEKKEADAGSADAPKSAPAASDAAEAAAPDETPDTGEAASDSPATDTATAPEGQPKDA